MAAHRRYSFAPQTALLYGVLVAVHLAMGLVRRGPYIFADETGYLLAARQLAGGLAQFRGNSFYHVGYSLFLVPAARMGSPAAFYTAMVVTNAVLLSAVFLVLVGFLRRVMDVEPRRANVLAFVASLYPPFILLSAVARSENLLTPLFVFAVLAFHQVIVRKTVPWGLALGASVPLLYVTHQRMLPVVPIGMSALAWLWVRRKRGGWGRATAAATAAFVGVLAIGVYLNVQVNVAGYSSGRRWSRIIHVVTDLGLDGVRYFFFEAVGQLWYLSIATIGLFLLGVVGIVRMASDGQDSARQVSSWFLLLNAAGLFMISVLFMMPPARSGAGHRIYGRYNEAFVAVFIAIGLHALWSERRRIVQSGLIAATVIVSLGILLPLGPLAASLEKGVVTANALAIVPALRLLDGKVHVAAITIAAAIAVFIVVFAAHRQRVLALVLVTLVFVGVSADVYVNVFLEADAKYRQLEQLAVAVEGTGAEEVAYDVTHKKSAGYYGYQFWLSRTKMRLFYSSKEPPPTRYVISGREWPEGQVCRARRLFVDPEFDQALWLCPELR